MKPTIYKFITEAGDVYAVSANLSLVLLILIENKRADHRLIHSTILENR